MVQFVISTKGKEVVDITDSVSLLLKKEKVDTGLCNLFVSHTTAALTVADLDPGTDKDILEAYTHMVPKLKYRHPHDPQHVGDHIMSALVGVSLTLPFKNGKLILGTWQRVILIDFAGSRKRTITLTVVKEKR